MSCGCKTSDADAQRKSDEVLDHVGLREIVDQGHGALTEASTALSHIARAERAEALGFGDDVVRMHTDLAARSNRRACQQLEFLLQRIDARAKADDWAGLVEQVQRSFGEHGGPERLEDARAEVRMQFLEQDPGLSGPVAGQALALLDHGLERARGGNLDSVLDLMREHCKAALEGFAADAMGRQPSTQVFHGPGGDPPRIAGGQNVNGWCVALAACLAWAYSSLIASLIACFVIPFCWCCFHLAVLGTFAVHQLLCIAAFAPNCR